MRMSRSVLWFLGVSTLAALWVAASQPLRYALVGGVQEALGAPSLQLAVLSGTAEFAAVLAPFALIALVLRRGPVVRASLLFAPLAGFVALIAMVAAWTSIVLAGVPLGHYEILPPAMQLLVDAMALLAAGAMLNAPRSACPNTRSKLTRHGQQRFARPAQPT